jgi:hypothetical protein
MSALRVRRAVRAIELLGALGEGGRARRSESDHSGEHRRGGRAGARGRDGFPLAAPEHPSGRGQSQPRRSPHHESRRRSRRHRFRDGLHRPRLPRTRGATPRPDAAPSCAGNCSPICPHAAVPEHRAHGLLTGREAAKWLGVADITPYVRARQLEPDERGLGRVLWFTEKTLEGFQRDWAKGGDGRRAILQGPDARVEWMRARGWLANRAERRGLGLDEAEAIVRAGAEKRRKRLASRRRGRPKTAGPSPLNVRRLRTFDALAARAPVAARLDAVRHLPAVPDRRAGR